MILFIQHIDIEGPGTLGEYLQKKGFKLHTVRLDRDEPLPENLRDLEAVVSLGGPMNVYEEEKYSFLARENKLIKEVLRAEIPFLGICLGSQLLAKAADAWVKKSPLREVGWFQVRLTSDGQSDPLFAGMERDAEVYQWHEDMWEMPQDGKLLATAEGCPHQAFKIGENAYGLQFHVEVTKENIADWCNAYFQKGDPVLQQQAARMLAEYDRKQDTFNMIARRVYDNFIKILERRKAAV